MCRFILPITLARGSRDEPPPDGHALGEPTGDTGWSPAVDPWQGDLSGDDMPTFCDGHDPRHVTGSRHRAL